MIDLGKVVNDEQLLDFALSHICEKNSDEVHDVADKIVILYIINELKEQKKDWHDESLVSQRYGELIADYILAKLSREGLVNVDFENGNMICELTPKGRSKL